MSDGTRPTGPHFSDPSEPVGDGMGAGVGPGSAADRPDRPDLTVEGEPRFAPARMVEDARIAERDPDPVGMDVVGCDGEVAGTVRDFWIDRAEPQVRYYELELAGGGREEAGRDAGRAADAEPAGGAGGPVLLPAGFAKVDARKGRIRVKAIRAEHFRDVPRPDRNDRITLAEEEEIVAYYGGGYLYAEEGRAEPLI